MQQYVMCKLILILRTYVATIHVMSSVQFNIANWYNIS